MNFKKKFTDIKGFTYIEVLSSIIIIFFVAEIFCSLAFFQRKIFSENILRGEYKRQLIFAESYLKRDLFQGKEISVISQDELLIRDYSGNQIYYYLALDPYREENMFRDLSKTLYRKVNNENSQPITQYFKDIIFSEENGWDYRKIKAVMITEKSELILEEYCDGYIYK